MDSDRLELVMGSFLLVFPPSPESLLRSSGDTEDTGKLIALGA